MFISIGYTSLERFFLKEYKIMVLNYKIETPGTFPFELKNREGEEAGQLTSPSLIS